MRIITRSVLLITVLLLSSQCGPTPTATQTDTNITDPPLADNILPDNQTPSTERSDSIDPSATEVPITEIPQETPTPQTATIDDLDEIYAELLARFGEDYEICQIEVSQQAVCEVHGMLTGSDPKEALAIQIILDSSGSMAGEINGQPKITSAKAALVEFIKEVPEAAQVAFRVYGHTGSNEEIDRAESCEGTELLYPFQNLDVDAFETAIDAFEPTGWTPIARSLEAAQIDFNNIDRVGGANFIYLVSDGIETCDGDPVTAARTLHESDIQAVINVIGFDVDTETAAQLQAVAEAGGGDYIEARTQGEIREAFDETSRALRDYYDCVDSQEREQYDKIYDALSATYDCIDEKARREYDHMQNAIRQNYADGLYDAELHGALIDQASNELNTRIDRATDEFGTGVDQAVDELDEGIDQAVDELDEGIDQAVDELDEELDEQNNE